MNSMLLFEIPASLIPKSKHAPMNAEGKPYLLQTDAARSGNTSLTVEASNGNLEELTLI